MPNWWLKLPYQRLLLSKITLLEIEKNMCNHTEQSGESFCKHFPFQNLLSPFRTDQNNQCQKNLIKKHFTTNHCSKITVASQNTWEGVKRMDSTSVKVIQLHASGDYTKFFFQSNQNTSHRAENI